MQEQIICNKEDLVAIADAVRASNGSIETYNVPELSVAAVGAIESGTGGGSACAILYTEQTLTDEQKEQARANIEAASTEAVSQLSEKIAVNTAALNEIGTQEDIAIAEANFFRTFVELHTIGHVLHQSVLCGQNKCLSI